MKAGDRVDKIARGIAEHFRANVEPMGFKAFLVAVDRQACALYKRALDAKLGARGLPPEWSDVIISPAQNSEPEIEDFEYPKAKQDELIEYFKLTPAEWETWNRERHGERRSQWRPPLKILIVCDRLLTGFDAPVEQVMFLDKPLRGAKLLQAIMRTNRPYPEKGKDRGVIVDYWLKDQKPGTKICFFFFSLLAQLVRLLCGGAGFVSFYSELLLLRCGNLSQPALARLQRQHNVFAQRQVRYDGLRLTVLRTKTNTVRQGRRGRIHRHHPAGDLPPAGVGAVDAE